MPVRAKPISRVCAPGGPRAERAPATRSRAESPRSRFFGLFQPQPRRLPSKVDEEVVVGVKRSGQFDWAAFLRTPAITKLVFTFPVMLVGLAYLWFTNP
jgi:hypothetical protein